MDQDSRSIIKIAVISDLHVMAPQLLVKDGRALEAYLERDRKMLRDSVEILDKIIDDILNPETDFKPDLVLVTGDLTKDGERVSHELVAGRLQRFDKAGIQVLVIPGNHDINNPDAKVYDGDTASQTDTITRREFAAIYRQMGYDERSRRDTDTLSYCRDVGSNLTILAIDACMDRYNTFISRGDAQDHCKTSGHLEPSSIQWIVSQAERATAQGRRVIAMMHHHLVPHFHMEDTLAAPYMVNEAEVLARQLVEAGVHVIFTGHLHISDICQTKRYGRQIIEIATAAAVGYPCQWRAVTCYMSTGTMYVNTRNITSLPSQPDFADHARQVFVTSIPTITRGVLHRYWSEVSQAIDNYRHEHKVVMRYVHLPDGPDAIAELLLKYLQEPVTRAYIAFAEGDEWGYNHDSLIEQLIDGVNHIVDETVSGLLRPAVKAMLRLRIYHIARLVLRSILEDRNDIGTKHESVVNDLTAILDM